MDKQEYYSSRDGRGGAAKRSAAKGDFDDDRISRGGGKVGAANIVSGVEHIDADADAKGSEDKKSKSTMMMSESKHGSKPEKVEEGVVNKRLDFEAATTVKTATSNTIASSTSSASYNNNANAISNDDTSCMLKWLSFSKSKAILNLNHLSRVDLPMEAQSPRGLAISTASIKAWRPPANLLQNYDKNLQRLSLQINFSLFHLKSTQFFGSSWLSTPVYLDEYYHSLKPSTSDLEKLHTSGANRSQKGDSGDVASWYIAVANSASTKVVDLNLSDICYLITKIVDPSCVLIAEVVLSVYSKANNCTAMGQYGCGWTYMDFFSGSEHFSSCKGNESMSFDKTLDLYQGSPRDLQTSHDDGSSSTGALPQLVKIGSSIQLSVAAHPKLLRAQRLLRENKFVSKFEKVPGLALKQLSTETPPSLFIPCLGFVEGVSKEISAARYLESIGASNTAPQPDQHQQQQQKIAGSGKTNKSLYLSTIMPAKPVLEIPEDVTVSNIKVAFKDLVKLENHVLHYFWKILASAGDVEVEVVGNILRLGVHNGQTLLGNQMMDIALERHPSDANCFVAATTECKLHGYIKHEAVAIVAKIDSDISMPVACYDYLPPLLARSSRVVGGRLLVTVTLGHCSFVPGNGLSSLWTKVKYEKQFENSSNLLQQKIEYSNMNSNNAGGGNVPNTLKAIKSIASNNNNLSKTSNQFVNLISFSRSLGDEESISIFGELELDSVSIRDLSRAAENCSSSFSRSASFTAASSSSSISSSTNSYKRMAGLMPCLSIQLSYPYRAPSIDNDIAVINVEVLKELSGVKKIYPMIPLDKRVFLKKDSEQFKGHVESLVRGDIENSRIKAELLKNKDNIVESHVKGNAVGSTRDRYSTKFANNEAEKEDNNEEEEVLLSSDDFNRVSFINASVNSNLTSIKVGFNLAKELNDPLKSSEIVFQFISYQTAAAAGDAFPHSIYFTFQFYKGRFIQTTNLELMPSKKSTNPRFHRLVVANSLMNSDNYTPYSLKHRVNRPDKNEERSFIDYLAHEMLMMDVWDAESNTWIGSCCVPLSILLRQGKSIARCGLNCDIVNYHSSSINSNNSDGSVRLMERGIVMGDVVGTIQLIASHIGSPSSSTGDAGKDVISSSNNNGNSSSNNNSSGEYDNRDRTWSEILNQSENFHVSDRPRTAVVVNSLAKSNTEISEYVTKLRDNSAYLATAAPRESIVTEVKYSKKMMTLTFDELTLVFRRFHVRKANNSNNSGSNNNNSSSSSNIYYRPILNLFNFPSPHKSIQKLAALMYSIGRSEFRSEFRLGSNGFIYCKDLEAEFSKVFQKYNVVNESFELSILINYLVLRTDAQIVNCKISIDALLQFIVREYKSLFFQSICNYFKEIVGKLTYRGADFLSILSDLDDNGDGYLTLAQLEQLLSDLDELFVISAPYKGVIIEHFQQMGTSSANSSSSSSSSSSGSSATNTNSNSVLGHLISVQDIVTFGGLDFKKLSANLTVAAIADSKEEEEVKNNSKEEETSAVKTESKEGDIDAAATSVDTNSSLKVKISLQVNSSKSMSTLIEEEKISKVIRDRCLELASSFRDLDSFLFNLSAISGGASSSSSSSSSTLSSAAVSQTEEVKRISIAALIKSIIDVGPLIEYKFEIPGISKEKVEILITTLSKASLSISVQTLTKFLENEIDIYRQNVESEYAFKPEEKYLFSSNIEIKEIERKLRDIGLFLKQNRFNSESVFSSFDPAGKGVISRKQLVEVFNSIGITIVQNSCSINSNSNNNEVTSKNFDAVFDLEKKLSPDKRAFHSKIKYVNSSSSSSDVMHGFDGKTSAVGKVDLKSRPPPQVASDLILQEQMGAVMAKIKQLRAQKKDELIRNLLRSTIVNIGFSAGLGDVAFFEFPLTNRFSSEEERYRILIDDPECSIVRHGAQWQLLRSSKCPTIGDLGPEPDLDSEYANRYIVSGSDSNEIQLNMPLRVNETVILPFIYQTMNPNNFNSSTSSSSSSVKTFNIRIVSESSGDIAYHLKCSVSFKGFVVSHTINFFETELKEISKSIVVNKSPVSIFQFNPKISNNKYVVCVEDSGRTSASQIETEESYSSSSSSSIEGGAGGVNRLKNLKSFNFKNTTSDVSFGDNSIDGGDSKYGKCCIDFEYVCKEYSRNFEKGILYFLIYNDPFHCDLSSTIRVVVNSCQRMDINLELSARINKIDFHVKGSSSSSTSLARRVSAFVSNVTISSSRSRVDRYRTQEEEEVEEEGSNYVSSVKSTLINAKRSAYRCFNSQRSASSLQVEFLPSNFSLATSNEGKFNNSSNNNNNNSFSLIPRTLNQFSANVTCFNPDVKSFQVNLVDADNYEMINSWIVLVHSSLPSSSSAPQEIVISLDKLKVDRDGHSKVSKKVPFRSPFESKRNLVLVSSNDALMKPKTSTITDLEPGATVDLKLSFFANARSLAGEAGCSSNSSSSSNSSPSEVVLYLMNEDFSVCEDHIAFSIRLA